MKRDLDAGHPRTIAGARIRARRALVGLAFAARLAGAGAAALSPATDPAVQQLADEVRTNGWITYAARSASGDWDLFRCRPDGSTQLALTRTPEFHEFAPQFSRDGRQLLYRRLPRTEHIDGNRYGAQGELVLDPLDGAAPRVLGREGELAWASWSPDGRELACLSVKGIFVVEAKTLREVRRLERKGFFQQITWSPDGQWLVGVANSYGTGWSVARLDLATGDASPIHRVDCCTPDWFPDSQHVVFSWRPPGQPGNHGQGWTQLWMAEVTGKSPQLVYGEDGRHVYGGQVSPDGKYVLFTGNMQEDGDPGNAGAPMALMRLADAPIIGGASRELRAVHPNVNNGPVLTLPVGWEPCWTPAELPTAQASNPPDSSASTDSTEHAASASSLAAALHDVGWLVFSARTADGDWDLMVMRPDGTDRRAITRTPEFNEGGVRFSPDGRRLLYYRQPKAEPLDNNTYGTFDLVLARADGQEPVVWGKAFPWATWGPDGTQLACLTPKGIQIIDVATRQVVRQFPRRGIVSQLGWSPDGRRFVGTANGLGPFWNIGCLDPDAGSIHAVSETERYNCTPDWTPDAQHIVYARGIIPQQPGHAELWVAAADGTSRRRIFADPDRHIYGACASPDGRFVLFTRSREDLGQVPEIEMGVIRWPSPLETNTVTPPRLDLGPGWEPHWATNVIFR